MKYQHRFRINVPLEVVSNFHRQPASLGAITPPPVVIRLHRAPAHLNDGSEMEFTLWLGPVPVHWLARIENTSPTGFTDRQLRGPFRKWVHRHTFLQVDETTTTVSDDIEFSFRLHPLWGPIGLGMWLSLPFLFAYRGWKTRRLVTDRQ